MSTVTANLPAHKPQSPTTLARRNAGHPWDNWTDGEFDQYERWIEEENAHRVPSDDAGLPDDDYAVLYAATATEVEETPW